ncbi:MAG TPA: CHAT domain-containing protein [Methylomirabilota bacterium]
MKRRASLLLLLMLAFGPAAWAADDPAEQEFRRGLDAFQRGAFADAVTQWSRAAGLYEREGNRAGQERALRALGQAHTSLGQYEQALTHLGEALALAEASRDPARVAPILASLGNVELNLGRLDSAEPHLRDAIAQARGRGDDVIAAAALNDLGTLLVLRRKPGEALDAYRESAALAGRAGHRTLAARGLSNASSVLRQAGKATEAKTTLDDAFDQVRPAAPSHDMAFVLVNIGLGYRDLAATYSDRGEVVRQAGAALNAAVAAADRIGDRRAASYARGYLGMLYEDERRYPEALELTQRALLLAQQITAPESLYRWQWQAGRVLHALGRTDEAIESYRRAITTLQSIRPELSVGRGGAPVPFREAAGRVYFEMVDLLLRRATARRGQQDITPYLVEARETVELFKAAELRDYFRDDCVDTALAKSTRLDVVSQSAVVVYPILMPDRIELLVSLPSGLKSVVVPVGEERLTQEVRQFRRLLEKRTTRQYLPHAQQLYDWLIRPLASDLADLKIDTLVFVPDGPLRTIPMGALHDGKQFLIAKYALGITPGLSLTDPRPIQREHVKLLALGVTQAVQGFPALPNVAPELAALRNLYGSASTVLVDSEFVVPAVEKKLQEERYTIVHIASHGEFSGDAQQSFVLAFDGKLSVDRLDQFIGLFKYRNDPLELLTLSACDTAEGDDRAALGLAGVAIKAGARSALATLWEVNDEVSAQLVIDFYEGLRDPSISRAGALRRAQLRLLEDPRYDHPGFWSPFLLINNWL